MTEPAPSKRSTDFDEQRSELEKKLRHYHKIFSGFAQNGNIQLQSKQMGNGQLNYGFDLDQPYFYNFKSHAFFEEPEVQFEFFNRIGATIEQEITPNLKTSLYSDQKTKMIQNLMALKNNPSSIKRMLIQHFHKRYSILELKKKKTFSRFSCLQKISKRKINSEQFLQARINLIELEQAQLHRRLKRLKVQDNFSESQQENVQRPTAINDVGDEVYQAIQDGEMCFSNISREDFEVFNRATIFENRVQRDLWKFYYSVKWIHYSERKEIFDQINNSMNSSRLKCETEWKNYITYVENFFIEKIKEAFPSSQNELKSVVSKIFSQMKTFNREQSNEFTNLFHRSDNLPIWPSSVIETNAQMISSAELFFENMKCEEHEIQKLIFKMNLIIEIIFDNQIDIDDFTPLEGSDDIDQDDPSQISKRIKENRMKDKMFMLEEDKLKIQLYSLLIQKQQIQIVETEWLSMLDFTPNFDESQHNVLSKLKDLQCPVDSTTQLIISNIGNKDIGNIKKMIAEITKKITESYDDKFFLFIENKKYFDKSHYSISYDLLVDTYKEGLKDSKPFDTSKSKKLESKDSLKKEYLHSFNCVQEEQKPVDSVLDSSYLLMFLKTRQNRRKILSIANAVRSIQRKVTYDLIKIFGCEVQNQQDDSFLFNVSDGKREELLLQQQKRDAHSSRKQPIQQKQKRKRMKSFSESKAHFDERYKKSLNPDVLLGRCDKIVYEDNPQMDELNSKFVPEILVKGDSKDGIIGTGKYILYDISDSDTDAIEERLLNTITFYIDKYEKKIFDCESRFQFSKLRLLEQYMQIFENVTDPVEAYNIAQRVLDLIEMVPTLDFKSLSFEESYEASIETLKLTTQLVKQLFTFQVQKENQESIIFHQRYQALVGIKHDDLMHLSEQYDGGSSLSKQTNQQMSIQFQEKITDKQNQKAGKNYSDSKQTGNSSTSLDPYWDSIQQYDEFCLEKNMEDVFEDIINNNLSENKPNVNQVNNLINPSGEKVDEESEKEKETKIRESIILNKNPSSEGELFLNFYSSCSLVVDIINLVDQIHEDLQTQLPQKSMIALQFQKSAILKCILKRWNNFNFKEQIFIEDQIICDNENNVQDAVQQSVKTILRTIEKHNQAIKDGFQSSISLDPSDRQFLLSLDYTALNCMANGITVPLTHNYRELYLNCNMAEFLQIREKLLHFLWERKALSKVYKTQFNYLGSTVKKHGEMYFPTPVIPSESFRTSKGSSGSRNPLTFLNEIDNSYDQQYIFKEQLNIQRFTQSDCLLEFQNLAVFEKLKLDTLENSVILNQTRLDPIQTVEFELLILQSKKVFVENPRLDIRRIYLTAQNIQELIKSVVVYKKEIRQDYLYDIKKQMEGLRNCYGQTYSEISSHQQKLSGPAGQILAEKYRQRLKIHLTQIMNEDILFSQNLLWGKVECLHLSRNIRKYLYCVPNINDHIAVQDDKSASGFSKFLYATQKKKDDEVSSIKQNPSPGDSISYNKLIIHSDDLISSKNFLDMEKKSYLLKSVDPSQIMIILESDKETQIKKEEAILKHCNKYTENHKVLKLLLKIIGEKIPDYGQYSYINDQNSQINSINLMYKSLLEFLQVHFLNIELCLYSSELKILQEQLLFNLSFQDIATNTIVKNSSHTINENEVSISLNCFDQMQAETVKKSFIAQQGLNPIRENLKIVNRIIDGLVRKLQSYSNMEESYKRMIVDLTIISQKLAYTVQTNSIKSQKQEDLKQIQIAPPQISEVEMHQLSTAFCCKIEQELNQFANLFHNKIFHNVFESFNSQCSQDPDTPLVNNFFKLNCNMTMKKQKNRLNLRFFNTQFYTIKNSNVYSTPHFKKSHGLIKPIFRKPQNSLYLKLRLLLASLPFDLRKTIFEFQEKDKLILGTVEELFKKIKESPGNQFSKRKEVWLFDLPAVGLQNYSRSNNEFIRTLLNLREDERFRIAGKIRNFEKQIIPIKVYKNESTENIADESQYVSVLVQNKILTQAVFIYKKQIDYPLIPLQLSLYVKQIKNGFNDKIQEVKNNFDEYKKRNFRFKNSQLITPFLLELLYENQDFDRTHNHLLSICLEKTFLIDDIQKMLLIDSIEALERESSVINLATGTKVCWEVRKAKAIEAQQNEGVGQTATNTIQVNPCYSSPLFVDPKQDIIVPNIAKLYYVQTFINRLRNKATRVDLLSSGFGFVISVNDLEDCIQFLSKIIWQDGDRELKLKNESWRSMYVLQNSQIKALTQQKAALRHAMNLSEKFKEKYINSQVHERGNSLVYQMNQMKRSQADISRFLNEIEGNVALELRKEMNADINKLQNEKQLLRNAFMEFKKIIKVEFKSEIKVANREMESQMNKKTIEFLNQINKLQQQLEGNEPALFDQTLIREAVPEIPLENTNNFSASQKNNYKLINKEQFSQPNDDDYDIDTDPVVITRFINKLRVFYTFKIGLLKGRLEDKINVLKMEISNFSDIQTKLTESVQEGKLVKQELINAHNTLTEQEKKLTFLVNELQISNFEKVKQEKTCDDLKKRVKQLEIELKNAQRQDDIAKSYEKTIREKDSQIGAFLRSEKEMKKIILQLNQANKRFQGVGDPKIGSDQKPISSNNNTFFSSGLVSIPENRSIELENEELSYKLREITKERDTILEQVNQLKRELSKNEDASKSLSVVSIFQQIESKGKRKEVAPTRKMIEQSNISSQLDVVLSSLEQKGIQKLALSNFPHSMPSPEKVPSIFSTTMRHKTEVMDEEAFKEKQSKEISSLYQSRRSHQRSESVYDDKNRSNTKSKLGGELLPNIFDKRKIEATPIKQGKTDSKGHLNKSFY